MTKEQCCCINCIYYIDEDMFGAANCTHVKANGEVYNNDELIIDEHWQCEYFTPPFVKKTIIQ